MSAHTPAPWKVEPFSGELFVVGGDYCVSGSVLCQLRKWEAETVEEWRANARLIAAAPDLLAALKQLREKALDYDDVGPCGAGWKSDELSKVLADAADAIAKAEGR